MSNLDYDKFCKATQNATTYIIYDKNKDCVAGRIFTRKTKNGFFEAILHIFGHEMTRGYEATEGKAIKRAFKKVYPKSPLEIDGFCGDWKEKITKELNANEALEVKILE